MGRGRKGVINQCKKKTNRKNNRGIAKVYNRLHKSDEKISLHEGALDFMKNMSQTATGTPKHQASMLLDVDLTSWQEAPL